MAVIRCTRTELAAALSAVDLPEGALVWVTDPTTGDGWEDILSELTDAFEASQRAAKTGGPIVYVVDSDDLLGRNGSGRAMVACGLLSAARTAAIESRKTAVPVNVVALEGVTAPDTVARWVELLSQPGGPLGELIRFGGDHLGRALP
jgi:hypothetical protein